MATLTTRDTVDVKLEQPAIYRVYENLERNQIPLLLGTIEQNTGYGPGEPRFYASIKLEYRSGLDDGTTSMTTRSLRIPGDSVTELHEAIRKHLAEHKQWCKEQDA